MLMSPLPRLTLHSELRNPTAVCRGPQGVAANAALDDADAFGGARTYHTGPRYTCFLLSFLLADSPAFPNPSKKSALNPSGVKIFLDRGGAHRVTYIYTVNV
jgi:hypothetical protein